MAGGAVPGETVVPTLQHATADVNRVEAPVTLKTYLMCAFAAFGGIFFGYDSGYISGVNGMDYVIHMIDGPEATAMSAWKKSLIVSILSAGTFFGALIAGDIAEWIGRKWTVIMGCCIFTVGVILQVAAHGLGLLVAGRLVAGFGVGFVSAVLIL
jgi:MFS family permease